MISSLCWRMIFSENRFPLFRIMRYRPIAQTVSMVMTIATNCSNTRSRISFWDRFGDPSRIMLRSPSNRTSATAPTATGSKIVLRKDAIAAT